ncbi:glycosyltransferase [Alteromonas sp. Cnat3-28]|uniref:glycosyltransferase family 2 protein n=1 Tax=Alteromonas sp. Cnat3-28 TaxID=2917729 RepID=UPI001EF57DA0|nr:glycosyltransferase [Alteromonas sp. Cnat3-28]MCG7644905.1 glycosyltransferase [Alteromonas sp. Cnat3-28]
MLDINTVKLRKESEIIASWENKDNPLVSIVCHSFQHEPYIETAIIGFLMQETTFAFEIIIHDDASTDDSPNIIQKYKSLYPNIVFPILQSENQYSKNRKPSSFTFRRANGRYVALCEGDDYWIDPNKLQSQYEALEKNNQVNLSIHDAFSINQESGGLVNKFPSRKAEEYIIPFKDVFTTTGQFSPTASMMMRTEFVKNLPDFFFEAPIGDFFLEVLCGREGILYLPQKMSVYRCAAVGSWSNNVLEIVDKRINMYKKYLQSLQALEAYLSESERKLVKYKKQIIYHNLALSYANRKNTGLAIQCFVKSFQGQTRISFKFFFILELLGLGKDKRKATRGHLNSLLKRLKK